MAHDQPVVSLCANKRPLTLSPGIVVTLGLILLRFLSGNDTHAQETPMPVISVDMPHGGCRLSIRKDGHASVAYGSMPRQVLVTPGTFDFEHVTGLLRSKSYAQVGHPFASQSVGTVSLPGSEFPRLIDDFGLIRSLLEKAWKARMAPTRDSPEEDHRWVAKVCSFAE